MVYTARFEQFTASDVERITGVNLPLQRDWRRRGFLPRTESPRAAFSPNEVANVLALAEFAGLGLGPTASAGLAKSAATAILWHALQKEGAVLDPHNLRRGEPVIHWPIGQQVKFVSTADAQTWTWAADEVSALKPGDRGRIVLNLEALGEHLTRTAGRQLVTIEAADE